jgi:5'-3' exonuclease
MFIIDGNYEIARTGHGQFAGKFEEFADQIAESFLSKAIHASRKQPVVVTWDGPRNPRRVELYPEYKSGRCEEKREQRGYAVRSAINALRGQIAQIECEYEADDAIAWIARRPEIDQSIIVSGDEDFYQLLGEGIRQWVPRKECMITKGLLLEEMGVSPSGFLASRAIAGDTSDSISGIPGVGMVTALDWVRPADESLGFRANAFDITRRVLELISESGRWRTHKREKELSSGIATVLLNLEIMDLSNCAVSPGEAKRALSAVEESSYIWNRVRPLVRNS